MKAYSIKEIAFVVAGSVLIFSGLLFFGNDRLIYQLLAENRKVFFVFGIMLVGLAVISGISYARTLDFLDNETPATVNVLAINIVLWCIFWVCWSGFNAIILMHYPVSIKVFIFSILLTTLPGIAFFVFAVSSRKDDMASRPLKYSGATSAEIAVYEKLLARPYYTGFYGILTVPVYLIVFVVVYLIK